MNIYLKTVGALCGLSLVAACGLDGEGVQYACNGDAPYLHTAINNHDIVQVRVLLRGVKQHRLDVNSQCKRHTLPLIGAAHVNEPDMVAALLESGARPNEQDGAGRTALMVAAEAGYLAVVKVLLEHDAYVDAKSKSGDRALMGAARQGHENIVGALLNANANPNLCDNQKKTALMFASEQGKEKAVARLLQSGTIDPNLQDGQDATALMLAVSGGHVGAVSELMQHPYVKLDIKNKEGQTALMLTSSTEIIEILRGKHTEKKHKSSKIGLNNTGTISGGGLVIIRVKKKRMKNGGTISAGTGLSATARSIDNTGHIKNKTGEIILTTEGDSDSDA